jgi:two-component system, NarL family, nitrate/nitrite response regulator NarL
VSEKVRILIVDDDAQFRQLLRLVLRRVDDFDVVGESSDGHSGIEHAEQLQPDVVLLDLMMPGMDGFEALPLIKAAHPTTSVIVLTALDADEAKEGVLYGASGYVEKRHITDLLESTIRTCRAHTS